MFSTNECLDCKHWVDSRCDHPYFDFCMHSLLWAPKERTSAADHVFTHSIQTPPRAEEHTTEI